jgi:hypothetical protein
VKGWSILLATLLSWAILFGVVYIAGALWLMI